MHFIPVSEARPGFEARYKIIYKNIGNSILSGAVSLEYPGDVNTIFSLDPLPDVEDVGVLSWNYSELKPFEIRKIDVEFKLNSPMDMPPLSDASILKYKVEISPVVEDENPEDNVFTVDQLLVNSYDPNDKTCLQGKTLHPDLLGEYLQYLIRFENTGSANAINVIVIDTIDTSRFDISTLMPLDGSHDFYTRINGNMVEFVFEDIKLPFDDEHNDGYLAFEIKPLSSLMIGDTISNSAGIYFDFNFPIITEQENTVVDENSSIHFISLNEGAVQVFPNPTSEKVVVSSTLRINHIDLYDVNNSLLRRFDFVNANTIANIDLGGYKAGLYVLHVQSDQGRHLSKVLLHR